MRALARMRSFRAYMRLGVPVEPELCTSRTGEGAVPGFEKVREIFTEAAFFVAAQGRQVFRAETLAV